MKYNVLSSPVKNKGKENDIQKLEIKENIGLHQERDLKKVGEGKPQTNS